MSRRSGQVGYVEKKGQNYRVRFHLDVPGVDHRVYKSVVICPVSGPGSLNKLELERRAMEIVNEYQANSPATLQRFKVATLETTFQQQAALWLRSTITRNRNPVKPGTVRSWKSALAWLEARVGSVQLSAFTNKLVKEHVVAKMVEEGLSAKTISNYVGVVKMVVASLKNDDGDEVFPKKWDPVFMDMPMVDQQHKPSFSADEVAKIVVTAEGQFAVLVALLAATGLRIGEALALQVEDVHECVIHVRRAIDGNTGRVQSPKTKNGIRQVDVHSSVAVMIAALGRESGFIFTGCQRYALEQLHAVLDTCGLARRGFHALRRYRNTFLRKNRVPDGLIQYWMGHAGGSMTDNYDRVRDDAEFRRFTAEQVGLGFTVPEVRKPPQHSPKEIEYVEAVEVSNRR